MLRRNTIVFITFFAGLMVLCITAGLSFNISTYALFNLHEDANSTTTPTTPPQQRVTQTNTSPTSSFIASELLTLPQLPNPAGIQTGIQMGWEAANVAAFETKTGISVDLVGAHIQWGNEKDFPAYLSGAVKEQGKTLVVFWSPMDYTRPMEDQEAYSYTNILSGAWDAYITSFAQQAQAYGGPVILIPLEEPNGNWDPWGGTVGSNSPEKYIAAYRYLHAFFAYVPNVRFGWAVNYDSVPDTPGNRLENYYPGDRYVDYVGVDGFNFGEPWLSFEEVFAAPLARLAQYRKPIYIFSIATAQGPKKAQWIREFLTSPLLAYYNVAGWIWFNEDKEKDWRVWSSPSALEAFKENVQVN